MGRFAAVVAIALGMVACSSGHAGNAAKADNVRFVVSSLQVEAGATPAPGAVDEARAGVTGTLEGYANKVVLPSLRAGGKRADLRPYFSVAAGARVQAQPDRAAFVDEGLPPATGVGPADSYPSVALVALVGPDGQVDVVTARFHLALRATAAATPLIIDRSGDLALVQDGDDWRIDSYAVTVTRHAAGETTTTTAG